MEPTLGQRLSRWLMFRGIRPAALARALETSRTATSNWVNDIVQPDVDKLGRVAEVLGISLAEFFGPLPDLHTMSADSALAEPQALSSPLGAHPSTGDVTRELDVVAMERAREAAPCPTCGRTDEAA